MYGVWYMIGEHASCHAITENYVLCLKTEFYEVGTPSSTKPVEGRRI